jgi:hypothetical protein
MKGITILAASLSLAACASVQPVPFKGPNGNSAYSMNCSGFGRSLVGCYQKAGEICPEGYTIIDRSSSVAAIPMNGSFVIAPRQGLAIECKG